MGGLNRFYYPTKYHSRNEVVSQGVTCVFLSHQQKDKAAAKKIADYLIEAGVDVYLDAYDGDLKFHYQQNDPKKVTNAICNGINNSSHMLVLVSRDTLHSKWVPFEVGYGYDKTDLSVLCLKGIPKGGLPEYIKAARVIRDIWDLNVEISNRKGKSKEFLLESKQMFSYDAYYHPLRDVMDSLINENS